MPATLNDPFCGHCGYSFVGLTDSARCPECGRPVVEVLRRGSNGYSKRYQSETKLFGLPLVAIARGPIAGERRGHARGIVAIGDRATGVIAIGQIARGGVAIGPIAIGVVALGSITVGLAALGAVAVGVVSLGAVSLGVVSVGSVSVYVWRGFGPGRFWLGRFL